MRWLAELDLLMAVDGYPSIADLRALRALYACDVSYCTQRRFNDLRSYVGSWG
jgi:hypothetical protein